MFPLWVWAAILTFFLVGECILTYRKINRHTEGKSDSNFLSNATPTQAQILENLEIRFAITSISSVIALICLVVGLVLRYVFGIDIA